MKVSQKVKSVVVTFLVVCCMLSVSASAETVSNRHIVLPENKEWTTPYGVTRSGDHYDVMVQCNAVYPEEGTDNFKKMQCCLISPYGIDVMDTPLSYLVLEEVDGPTYIRIRNGFLNLDHVYFRFRGNSNSAANAIVTYSGR